MAQGTGFPERVLMTVDAVGGVWPYALDLARGLCRGGGIQVLLAGTGPGPSPAQRAQAAAIDALSLCWRPFRLEWMEDADDDLEDAASWLADLQAEFDPDLVHLNGYALAASGLRTPVIVVCHSCVRTWWRAVHGTDAPAAWDRYTERVVQGLDAADLVIAPTHAFLAAIGRTYGDLPHTMVIHNGRDGAFAPADKEPFVFSCGRVWDLAKGGDLLDGLARHSSWPVYLAGEARSPDGTSAPPPSDLRPLGHLDEARLAAWLARASIYALPARYEPFGLSALEAAKSGCALVLGDIETLRELWGDAALYAAPSDEESLVEATSRLIGDDALRRTMAARAFRHAGRYRSELMVGAYVNAYRRARAVHDRAGAPADGWSAGAWAVSGQEGAG